MGTVHSRNEQEEMERILNEIRMEDEKRERQKVELKLHDEALGYGPRNAIKFH